MSSPSPSCSERAISANHSPLMLTPGQKIRAMMAEFDSDSESDSHIPRSRTSISKLDFGSEMSDNNDATDEETENSTKDNSRFLALVARKRLEREEREKIQLEKEAVKRAQIDQLDLETLSEDEIERDGTIPTKNISPQARQPRKASKKAMDEMNRETQRLSRNMQLAHQSQTKKKITKESLFAKFNFMQPDTTLDKSKVDAANLSQIEADGPSAPLESTTVPSTDKLMPPTLSVRPKKSPRQLTRPPVRVIMSREEVAQHQKDRSDSDDDLEVVTLAAKSRRVAVFENLPAQRMQEPSSMIKLKALAHLSSPPRKGGFTGPAELSADLLYKARQQAAKERKDRIAELKAKGVVIETAEERAAMEDDMENLVEKARLEADTIARQERADRKKKQGIDEEDYDNEYEFSGSDEADDESDIAFSEDEDEDDVAATRVKRRTRIVSDDEDEEDNEIQQVPSTPIRSSSNAAHSVERPQFPGMEIPNMSMGLTQVFASTLADDESDTQPSAAIPFSLPEPVHAIPKLRAEESEILVHDSQGHTNAHDFSTPYSPNLARVSESPAGQAFSQFSQLPDPTQDEGFVFSPFDPSRRFRGTPPVSTVETVLLDQTQPPPVSSFNVIKKPSKKKFVPYDKNASKAKNIVDEAAEESEDEYAGIGGASDDEEDEENAYDKQMINDNSGEIVDEKQLAALNALHQRNRDEKDVAKLMKDITTGALRRRRGGEAGEFDLDDSDDERAARRREKQREFAKMRRALLADDKVGELAENPKKAAFFRAIEDREVEDDFELEILEEEGASQMESSQNAGKNTLKRPLESSADDPSARPPARLRRTAASTLSKKPASLAEIRETLSFLTETHDYDSFHEDASLDDEPEEENDEHTSQDQEGFAIPANPRRTRGPVVDRLSLLRQASSNSASSGASATKSAFHSRNNDGRIGFRPPQLLRRMTTGSSTSSASSTSSNSHRVTKSSNSGAKKGGSVNSYTAAREKERERQLRAKERNGSSSISKLLDKHAGGGLGALVAKGQWD